MPKHSQLLPEGGWGALRCKEPGIGRKAEEPATFYPASASFPAARSLGKPIPTSSHHFHSRFQKIEKRKGPAGWQTPRRNCSAGLRSLGSQQSTTPNRIDRGKPQGKKASCRGTGLLSASCREVPGEGTLVGRTFQPLSVHQKVPCT